MYADLVADVSGFEELVRIRIAVEVGKAFRAISLDMLGQWLDVRSRDSLEKFVKEGFGWSFDGGVGVVWVPANKENETRSEVKSEHVGVEMFGRVLRRGFEQAA